MAHTPIRRAALAILVLAAPILWTVTTWEPPAGPPGAAGAYLGILTGPTRPVITGVVPASPAEAAGLRPGDVLRTIDGRAVGDPGRLRQLVRARRPGDRVVVRLSRDGQEMELTATLGSVQEHRR